MKKAILFLLALLILSAVTNAQNVFDQNSRLLNVGVGMGGNYYHFARGNGFIYRHSPVFSFSYEQAYAKPVGPGLLGIGGLLTYQSTLYRNENIYWTNNDKYFYEHRYRNYVIAARVAYHWEELQFSKAELYGGAIAGLRIQSYRFNSNYPGDDVYYREHKGSAVRGVLSAFIGGRWYFASKAALYGEISLGYGIPYGSLGLTFKL